MKIKFTCFLLLIHLCAAYGQKNFLAVPLDTTFSVPKLTVPDNWRADILSKLGEITPLSEGIGDMSYISPYLILCSNSKKGGVTIVKLENKKIVEGGVDKYIWNIVAEADGKLYREVDFSLVGGTIRNSGIFIFQRQDDDDFSESPDLPSVKLNPATNAKSFIMVGENWLPNSNEALTEAGITDISDYTIPSTDPLFPGQTIKRFENMGWMVHLDLEKAKAVKKYYGWGRIAPKTAAGKGSDITYGPFIVSGAQPSLLFTLFFSIPEYPVSPGDETPEINPLKLVPLDRAEVFVRKPKGWASVDLPSIGKSDNLLSKKDLKNLINACENGLKKNAYMFNDLRSIVKNLQELSNETYYLAEHGKDMSGDLFTNKDKIFNGVIPTHLKKLDSDNDGVFNDYYGRILCFGCIGDSITVYLEGGEVNEGRAKALGYHFSNPDKIEIVDINTLSYPLYFLMMSENISDISQGRNPTNIPQNSQRVNEVYWATIGSDFRNDSYQATKKSITHDDLNLFIQAPQGTDISGSLLFTDLSTNDVVPLIFYFISSSTPHANNQGIYSVAGIYAVTEQLAPGAVFNEEIPTAIGGTLMADLDFAFSPNPSSEYINFTKQEDIIIYNMLGMKMSEHTKILQLNVSTLVPGVYILKNKNGKTSSLIIKH